MEPCISNSPCAPNAPDASDTSTPPASPTMGKAVTTPWFAKKLSDYTGKLIKESEKFFKKMEALGFSASETAEIAHLASEAGLSAMSEYAEKYLTAMPYRQEQFIRDLKFIHHEIFGGDEISSEFINNVILVVKKIMVERSCSLEEAVGLTRSMINKSMSNAEEFITAILDEQITYGEVDALLQLESEELPLFRIAARIAGLSDSNALYMREAIKDYNPTGLEGLLSGLIEGRDRTLDSNLTPRTRLPEWVKNQDMRAFAEELSSMDIEPAEIFRLLMNNTGDDIPRTKEEFLKVIAKLHEKNGLERFSRYSMKVLLSACYPTGGRKNALILASKADHNNAFYGEFGKLDDLVDQGHNINLYEVGSIEDVSEKVREASIMVPIDLLVIAGHGGPDGVQLGGNLLKFLDGITSRDLYGRFHDLLNKALSPNAQIVLIACSTGAWDSSFAGILKEKTGRQVFANDVSGGLRDWAFNPDGSIEHCFFADSKGRASGRVF